MQTYIGLLLILIIILYVGWNLRKIYPKTFAFPKEVFPSKTELRITMVSILLVSLAMFLLSADSAFRDGKFRVNKAAENNFQQKLVMKDFTKVIITGEPYLQTKENTLNSNPLTAFLHNNYDLLNSLALLVVCIVAVISLWNFDFKDPFKIKLSRAAYQIGLVIIIYATATYLLAMSANSYTLSRTSNEFGVIDGIPFAFLFKVWLGGILLRIGQIFRHAEKLREDQALTV